MIIFFFSSISIFSQTDEIPLLIGIGTGLDLISNKDLATSPLKYKGFGLPVGINVFNLKNRIINHFELRGIFPALTNNYPLSSSVNTTLSLWTKIDLHYHLLYKLNEGSSNYLGVALDNKVFLKEHDFLDGYSWETLSSINITVARKVNLGRKSFLLPSLGIPIFGYLHRKSSLTYDEEFLDDFNRNGGFSLLKYGQWRFHLDEWQAFNIDLLYHYKLSEKWSFQTSVGLNYYQIEFPESVHNINIPIRCYINYHL